MCATGCDGTNLITFTEGGMEGLAEKEGVARVLPTSINRRAPSESRTPKKRVLCNEAEPSMGAVEQRAGIESRERAMPATRGEVMKLRSRCCWQSAPGLMAYDDVVDVKYVSGMCRMGVDRRERAPVHVAVCTSRDASNDSPSRRISAWRSDARLKVEIEEVGRQSSPAPLLIDPAKYGACRYRTVAACFALSYEQ